MEESQRLRLRESILNALTSRGWCFRDDPHQILTTLLEEVLLIKAALSLEVVEAALLNLDLKLVGGKSLPESSAFKKCSSYLQGPKILQVVSVRDVSKRSMEESFKNSSQNQNHRRRILRFCLTDGYLDIIAVEYAPLKSITNEIVPGTKVLIQNKTPIRHGILCLEPKFINVLGGLVPSIYEEWQMNRKYSGFARSELKSSQNTDSVGPPPFEKLQVGAFPSKPKFQDNYAYSSKATSSSITREDESLNSSKAVFDDLHVASNVDDASDCKASTSNAATDMRSDTDGNNSNPCTSEARPKNISEAVPVQNQAAAQKLLQKMTMPNGDYQRGRGRGPRQRQRSRPDEPEVFTLDEWERRKANVPIRINRRDICHDEEVARQLQMQLDLEDQQVVLGHEKEAENLRSSLFNFNREETLMSRGRGGFTRRGRGRRGQRRSQ